jgi:hypothetical protein
MPPESPPGGIFVFVDESQETLAKTKPLYLHERLKPRNQA